MAKFLTSAHPSLTEHKLEIRDIAKLEVTYAIDFRVCYPITETRNKSSLPKVYSYSLVLKRKWAQRILVQSNEQNMDWTEKELEVFKYRL